MGLYGTFQRLTPAQADELRAHPDRVRPLLDRHRAEPPGRPFYHLDKAWHAVMHLVEQAGIPSERIFGRTAIELPRPEVRAPVPPEVLEYIASQLGVAPEDIQPADDDDWPTLLDPGEVAAAAEILAATPASRLAAVYDPAEMSAQNIYPEVWDREDEDNLAWVLAWFDGMEEYFADAAKAGDAILFWVS